MCARNIISWSHFAICKIDTWCNLSCDPDRCSAILLHIQENCTTAVRSTLLPNQWLDHFRVWKEALALFAETRLFMLITTAREKGRLMLPSQWLFPAYYWWSEVSAEQMVICKFEMIRLMSTGVGERTFWSLPCCLTDGVEWSSGRVSYLGSGLINGGAKKWMHVCKYIPQLVVML